MNLNEACRHGGEIRRLEILDVVEIVHYEARELSRSLEEKLVFKFCLGSNLYEEIPLSFGAQLTEYCSVLNKVDNAVRSAHEVVVIFPRRFGVPPRRFTFTDMPTEAAGAHLIEQLQRMSPDEIMQHFKNTWDNQGEQIEAKKLPSNVFTISGRAI